MPRIMLKGVTIVFADKGVFELQEGVDGNMAYGLGARIEPGSDHEKQIKSAMIEAAKEKWPDNWKTKLEALVENKKVCFSSKPPRNAEGEIYSGFEGGQGILNVRRGEVAADKKGPPLVIGGGVNGKGKVTKADGVIYSGAVCNVSADIWADDRPSYHRVNGDFRGVQFVEHGERLGGGGEPTSEDEFDDLDRTDDFADAMEGQLDNGAPSNIDDDILF